MLQVRLGVGALCALVALASSSTPAAAQEPHRRSLARCTRFEQHGKTEVSLELSVSNTCSMPIDCTVSWEVVCAPESRKRRRATAGSASFTVQTSSAQAAEASAATCGDDSWVIRAISWRCEPSKE